MNTTRSGLLVPLIVFAVVATGCGDDSSNANTDNDAAPATEGDRLSVVVTTTIWGDIVSNVTGDAATVDVLFPVGADAHDYQLSSAQVASIQEADLVVVNGLQLEEGLRDVIESLEAEGANILEVAPELDPIAFKAGGHSHDDEEGKHSDERTATTRGCDPDAGHEEGDHNEDGDAQGEVEDGHAEEEGGHEDEDGHAHGEGTCDPHVWMDPLRVVTAVEQIAEELAALDQSVDWMAYALPYGEELRALDEEVMAMLELVAADQRRMVTNHEAFGYFAERYDFEVVGVVIPGGSTLADPSSAELAELVEIMTEENIDVIFAETVEPSALADAVAAEVGSDVHVVELFTGSLGGSGTGAETYVDMIRTNTALIAEALS